MTCPSNAITNDICTDRRRFLSEERIIVVVCLLCCKIFKEIAVLFSVVSIVVRFCFSCEDSVEHFASCLLYLCIYLISLILNDHSGLTWLQFRLNFVRHQPIGGVKMEDVATR